MSNKIDYGKLTKKIVFTENDHRQAKLIIKLKQEGLSQSAFFRHIITAFLEEDERIISYIDEVKQQSQSRKSKTKQLVDIFDIIAEEHPDL